MAEVTDVGPWFGGSSQLNQEAAETPDIAAGADRVLSDDLGRHPEDATFDVLINHARVGHAREGGQALVHLARVSEIGQLHILAVVQDVRRFQVAVDDFLLVVV